jgi:hypothetical protein
LNYEETYLEGNKWEDEVDIPEEDSYESMSQYLCTESPDFDLKRLIRFLESEEAFVTKQVEQADVVSEKQQDLFKSNCRIM